MNKPQVVRFSAFGRIVPALVLAAREGEVSHLGADGEPTLTLALLDPQRETGLNKDPNTGEFIYPAGRTPQVFIEHDVVHESHEFDEEFLKQHGSTPAQIASQRGHGEWSDYLADDEELVTGLRRSLTSALSAKADALDEVGRQRARADKAEADLAAAVKAAAEKPSDPPSNPGPQTNY